MKIRKYLSWPKDEAYICNLIEKERATLKIVTKMKNETYFVEKWILHHLKILGNTRLIIFDNMSTEDSVFEVYEKYKNNIILISFDMYMDCIHMASKFFSLYQALAKSTKYFTIIDADEFLCLYDQNTITSDHSIVSSLKRSEKVDFFAPLWLQNVENMENKFKIDRKSFSSANSSKPIVHSNIIKILGNSFLKGNFPVLHHTLNLPLADYKNAQTKFLLLHLKHVNLYLRIRSNMQKLVAFGVVNNVDDYKSLLTARYNPTWVKHANSYINETKSLVNSIINEKDTINNVNSEIDIASSGVVSFSCSETQVFFDHLINANYLNLIEYDHETGLRNQCKTIKEFLKMPKP